MNLLLDLHLLGGLLGLVGFFQLIPVGVALAVGEPTAPYLASAALTMACGLVLFRATRTTDQQIRPRDGFFVVGCAWLLSSLFGALPYLFTGALPPVDALFESVSGFTTTGSTVMIDIEGAPRPLLLWRSFTQWIGGMGIIVFTIALLPLLGIGGMQLFSAEMPGPIKDKARPRVAATARRLWFIYVGFTGAEMIALRLAGLGWFDAVCHAFTTMPTGGFSTRNDSIAGFASPAVEWIVIFFMLLAGINFVLHYRVMMARRWEALKDTELLYFLSAAAVAAALLTLLLLRAGMETEGPLRTGLFQAVSILTTTGYVTADFNLWPNPAAIILLVLMVFGGMSGSTAGGVKSLRTLVGLRSLWATVDRLIHPHAVRPVKYSGRPVDENVLHDIWAFFAAYLLIAAVAAAIVSANGYNLETSISAAISALSNVGPGLGAIGAAENFAHLPGLVKLVLSFCMIAGRLEVFTVLVLILPAFWRR
jgi:trk system potassium uptake protein TrkH